MNEPIITSDTIVYNTNPYYVEPAVQAVTELYIFNNVINLRANGGSILPGNVFNLIKLRLLT